MRPGQAGAAIVLLATALAASGATRARSSADVVRDAVKKAIAAEQQALKDVRAGRFDDARRHLKGSQQALGRARGETSRNAAWGSATADLRQAGAKDDVALANLRPHPARDPALAINQAIVHKQSALDWVGDHATAAPAPNRPPRVTQFQAQFPTGPNNTTTRYTVTATDPDGDPLTYTWTKQQPDTPCGVFQAQGNVATWDHPGVQQGGDCPHLEEFHRGTITVVVSDGKASCTVVDPNGSRPVAPFDPGETCATQAKATLAPDDAAERLRWVNKAIALEQKASASVEANKAQQAISLLHLALDELDAAQDGLGAFAGLGAADTALQQAKAYDGDAEVALQMHIHGSASYPLSRALAAKKRAATALAKLAKR